MCLRPLCFHTRRHSTASTARLYLATCTLRFFASFSPTPDSSSACPQVRWRLCTRENDRLRLSHSGKRLPKRILPTLKGYLLLPCTDPRYTRTRLLSSSGHSKDARGFFRDPPSGHFDVEELMFRSTVEKVLCYGVCI